MESATTGSSVRSGPVREDGQEGQKEGLKGGVVLGGLGRGGIE